MSYRDKDEQINKFIHIAQCPREVAIEYLENAQWNEHLALDYFLEIGESQFFGSPHLTHDQAAMTTTEITLNTNGKVSSDIKHDDVERENLLRGSVIENHHPQSPEKLPNVVLPRLNTHKSIISSKIYIYDGNGEISEDNYNDDDDNNNNQTSSLSDLQPSRQQVFQPSTNNDDDYTLRNTLEATRKVGAFEVDRDESSASSRINRENPFSGAGYSLENDHISSVGQDCLSSSTNPNKTEQVPIRFYSNGFTVGDGELRPFEENGDFIDFIKRGEIPPELRNLSSGGKEIEINLEDHRSTEYKFVAPVFKAFHGAGHVVGLSESRQFPSNSLANLCTYRTDELPDPNVLEKISQTSLKTSSSSTSIRLRLPGISVPVRIELDVNRTLMDVRSFLNENVPSLRINKFEFMEPPSTKINHEDEKCKICDTKLANSTLFVRLVA